MVSDWQAVVIGNFLAFDNKEPIQINFNDDLSASKTCVEKLALLNTEIGHRLNALFLYLN